jgi:hypothetical protein
LSEGDAGAIHGGDRLPWVHCGRSDNFAALRSIAWQINVYGQAKPALRAYCAERNIALHVFDWLAQHQAAGLARDALYLIRPDTYVALADIAARPQAVDNYFTKHGIKLHSAQAMPTAQPDNAARSGDLHES